MSNPSSSLRFQSFAELLLVVGVLVAVKQSLLPLTVVFAGPASTLSAMIVATYLLHRRGCSWHDLGLKWPESWVKILGLAALVFLLLLVAAGGFGALASLFFEDIGTSGRFDFVEGNLAGYLLIMAVVWTHGSFFEELLFRAFAITRLGDSLGGTKAASLLAVVVAAVFFGYRHYYYQGMHGALVTGGIGLVFGFVYLAIGRRNILPLVIAHGLANSIAQTQRFLG